MALLTLSILLVSSAFAFGHLGGQRELGAEVSPINSAYVSTYEVVMEFPHDPNAFTQGLIFDAHGQLYESDGLYRQSAVRIVEPRTGASTKRVANPAHHFGEGLAIVGERMLQLTWKEQVVNEFSLPDLQHKHSHKLPCGHGADAHGARCAEGWGLAYDGAKLYMTDSTDKLFFLDPTTLRSVAPPRQIYDPRMERPVHGVNELEWVDGELWGNVLPLYQGEASECIVRLNASDATVLGWIDARGLLARQRDTVRRQPHNLVLNGIAYHEPSKRLYVTGKQWDHMYQVRVKAAPPEHQTAQFVEANCHLGRADGRHAFG